MSVVGRMSVIEFPAFTSYPGFFTPDEREHLACSTLACQRVEVTKRRAVLAPADAVSAMPSRRSPGSK